jgi:hypothetical protein
LTSRLRLTVNTITYRRLISARDAHRGAPARRRRDTGGDMTDDRPEMPDSLTGGCMCRGVCYKISAAPIAAGLCHCDRCRPQIGQRLLDRHHHRTLDNRDRRRNRRLRRYRFQRFHVARRYCPRCGSPLTTESDAAPDLMFVKAGGIDANEWLHPVMELFCGPATASGRPGPMRTAARRQSANLRVRVHC